MERMKSAEVFLSSSPPLPLPSKKKNVIVDGKSENPSGSLVGGAWPLGTWVLVLVISV